MAVAPGIFLRLLHDVDGWRFVSWSYATGQEAAPSPVSSELRRTFSTKEAAVQHFQAIWPRYAALGHAISEADRQRMAQTYKAMKHTLESLERQALVLERTDSTIALTEPERRSLQQIRDRIRHLVRVLGKQV